MHAPEDPKAATSTVGQESQARSRSVGHRPAPFTEAGTALAGCYRALNQFSEAQIQVSPTSEFSALSTPAPPAKHQMLSKIHFRKLLAWQLPAKNSHLPKSLRGRQLRGHQEMYGHSLASSKQLPKCVFLYNANSCAHSPHFLTLLPGSRKPPQFNLQGNYICGLKTAEQREKWYQWDRLIHHSGISSNFHVCKIWRSLSGKWV